MSRRVRAARLACLGLCVLASGCPGRGDRDQREQRDLPAGQPGERDPPGERAGQPGERDPDATITLHLEAEPVHLSPLLVADGLTQRVALGDIYEGLLCQHAPDAPAAPCLAARVHDTDGGARWTFELRAGVVWHDGAPLTVDDVLFTYGLLTRSAAGQGVATWLADDFDDLLAVERAGERAVRMTFAGFRLGRREAFARVPILPAHLLADRDRAALTRAALHRRPVGTGPLRLASWQPGEAIVLERFDRYWGQAAGAARVVHRIIPHRGRALRELAAGHLDLALQVPMDELAAAARDDVRVFRYDRPAYLAAVYNLRAPALADARARRALTLLMDRPAIAQALFAGHARPIAGPYLARDPDRDPALAPLPFDRAAAAALLADAGVARGARLTVLVPAGSRTMARVADIWAADAAPHLDLRVEILAYADVLARLREGHFDIALLSFTTGLDLDLYSRFHSRGRENHGALSDPALDRALEAVRAEPDPGRRRALQRQVQARLHALQPYTFIAGDTRAGLARAAIGDAASAAAGARALWRAP